MTEANDSFRVLGLLGGMGAGKSLVAAELERLGCVRIDADATGHELLATGPVRDAVRARWGEAVFADSGEVDRKALGAIVFADPAEMDALQAILHPAMREEFERQVEEAKSTGAVGAVLDAAVMLEAQWDDLCDVLIFVDAAREVRLERVQTTRGWDEAELAAREKQQISLDIKAKSCCYTLDNSSSPSHLRPQVVSLFHAIFS